MYSKFGVNVRGKFASRGQLLARTVHGRSSRIGTVDRFTSDFTLAGAMLVYLDGDEPDMTVHWRNLATGTHGSLPWTEDVYAAAPNGWVYVHRQQVNHRDVGVVYLHTVGGTTTRLGSPDPNGSGFNLSVGGNTLVADQAAPEDSYGSVRTMSFAHPGRFRTIVPNDDGGTADCVSVTGAYLACAVSTKTAESIRLYRVDGTLIRAVKTHCPIGQAAVLADSVAWVAQGAGCSHQLRIAPPKGMVRETKRTFAPDQSISAFGGIVLPTESHHELVYFASPTKSTVLVQTH